MMTIRAVPNSGTQTIDIGSVSTAFARLDDEFRGATAAPAQTFPLGVSVNSVILCVKAGVVVLLVDDGDTGGRAGGCGNGTAASLALVQATIPSLQTRSLG
jgi:hypothetical protein